MGPLYPDMGAVSALTAEWRAEAALYRRRGQVALADMAESFAGELEARVQAYQLEALTLEQAATESGYSYSALEKSIRAGRLENAGTRYAPRIRRADLPRKAKREQPGLADEILLRRLGG